MTKSMNQHLTRSTRKNINHKVRDLRMESLEERQLLSVSPASAASDDVDYACIAPAEMTPLESAPVVEMNLTDQVPTLDAPVALGADLPEDGNICGYHFELEDGGSVTYEGTNISISGSVTITDDGNDATDKEAVAITCDGTLNVNTSLAVNSTIKKGSGNLAANISGYTFTPADTTTTITATTEGLSTSGTVTITDNASAADQAVAITGSGTLNVETSLLTGSSVTMTSGTLTVGAGATVPTVNSDGITIEGAGDIAALNLNGGTTTVNSIGTITSATGDNNLTVNGGTVTGVTSNGTVSVSDSGTINSFTSTSGSLSVGSGCTVTNVYSSGITVSGTGNITTLNLTAGTTTVNGITVANGIGSGALKVTNSGSVNTVTNSTDITLESGTIGLVNLVSGTEESPVTTTINGAGKITEVKSIGNSIISGAGNIGKLTLTDGTTTTVSGTTIDETSTGTGNLTVTGGKVTNSYTSGAISVSGGTVTNIENSKEITLNTPGTIGTVTLVSGTDENNPAVTTINGSGTIGTVKSNGSSDIAGSGKIGTLTLNSGTTDVSGTTVSEITGAGVLHVSGGAVTEAKGSGAVSISAGTIDTVTNASGVQCTAAGKITTVTIAGLTEVSTNGHIDSVTGTGAVSITGGTIGSVTNASGVTSSGGTITTVEISGTTTLEGDGTIDEVKGSGAVIISDGKINKVSGSNSISLSYTGEIGTVSGNGDIAISGGKITTVSGDGEITVDGGTIEHITSAADGPVTINGTENPDTITVGQTVTVGSTASVTFDSEGAAPVTINGGEGDDTITANAKPTSGTLTASVASGTDTFNGTGTIDSLTVDNATANITNGTITAASGLGKIKVTYPGTVTNSITLTSGLTVDFRGYTFTGTSEGATITITGANTVSVSGNVTVSDDASTSDTNIDITSASGNLTVNTTLAGTSSVTIGSGSELSIASGKTVPAVNSSGCTISGSGTVTALNLTAGTTTVSGGTVGTATGAGAVNVTGGTITNANGTGAVSISGGTIGKVTNASSVECSGGTITTVTTSGTTTVSGTGAITNVNGDGAVSISGGSIDTVTNASGVECSGGTIDTVTTSGTTTVSGTGAITNVNGDGAVSISAGTIDKVSGNGAVTVTGGTITTASGNGNIAISGGEITTASGTGTINVTGGTVGTASGSGLITISNGEVTNVTGDSAISISNTGEIGTVSGNGDISISGGEIATASGSGTITITDGTIGAVTGASPVTVDGGTINSLNGSGAVVINGTNGNDEITVGETLTTGTASVTFGDSCASEVTINGGEGADYIKVTGKKTSGAMTINGGAGNDVLISGGEAVTVNGEGGSDLVVTGAFTGSDDTLKTWDGDAATALNWSLDGTLSGSTVAAATASATVNADNTDMLYYNTSGAAPTINGTPALVLTSTSTTVVVTAASESDTSATTITMSEAYTALNGGTLAGDYTLGFTNANYTLDQALTSNYTNTGHKLTIDGTKVYNGVTGEAGSAGTVTVTVGNFTNTDANMTFAAGTTVVIDGLVYTGVTLEENETAQNTGVGIYNNGTLTLTGGAKVSNFNNTGIVNNSSNTLIIDDGSVISGNTGHGIQNTATGTLYLINGQVIQNGGDGIYNEGTVKVGKDGTEGSATDVTITNNGNDGIENATGGVLEVYDATISGNTVNGINNAGTATIEGTGYGAASTVQIEENPTGIYNTGTLEVSNANIADNADYGINNAGGTATLEGFYSAVQITGSETGILNSATLDITGAIITGNTNIGIDNQNGVAKIKGRVTGTRSNVQVTGQPLGIYNTGAASNLEISGVYITTNTTNGVGIQNHGGNATLKGATLGAVQVTGSKTGILNEYVDANQKGNLTITGASVRNNREIGIDNKGGIVTINGERAASVVVNYNRVAGIRNINASGSTAVLAVNGATIDNNGKASSSSDYNDGIYNDGTATIGVQGDHGANEVLITNNTFSGIDNRGNLTMYNGTVSGSQNYGIDTRGTANLNGNTPDALQITGNIWSGIRNIYKSTALPGVLNVTKATISSNSTDGINNEKGTVTIGTQGSGVASDVVIANNARDGIENKNQGNVTIYNATINKNGTLETGGHFDFGIYNNNNATMLLDGNSADAIVISKNGRSDTDVKSGGVFNDTTSNITIRKATITENHYHGIENDGTMVVGIDNDGVAGDVLITSNKGDGIENKGTSANLTVYNATISNNANSEVDGFLDHGIDNHDGGKALLDGNTAAAIYISGNGRNDIDPKSGGIYNGTNSEFTIIKATVTENHHHGIENDGTMTIGTEPASGSTTVGAASDVQVTKNKGNGIDNDDNGTLRIYNGNISQNDIGSHEESNIDINNGIRNDGTVVIGVEGSTEADAVTINENRGNGILNRTGGSVTVYNASINGNDNDVHVEENPNNNGIRNDTGAMLKLLGTGTGTSSSIKITGNGEDGIYNQANLNKDENDQQLLQTGLYIQGNGSDGIEIKNLGSNAWMNIGSATVTENGRFGIHVKSGTAQLLSSSVNDIVVSKNQQSGIRVEKINNTPGTLLVEKAKIIDNAQNGPYVTEDGLKQDLGDGINSNGGSSVTIGTTNGSAGDVIISGNSRGGIQNSGSGTTLTIYNATITKNAGYDQVNGVVTGYGINNNGGKVTVKASGTTEAPSVLITNNTLRGIINKSTFTQESGVVQVSGNVGGGIDNQGSSAIFKEDSGAILNVKNNVVTAAGEDYKDGAGIKNTGTLTLNGTTNITGNIGIRNGGGLYQGGKLTNDLNGDLTIQNNTAENGGGVYVAAYTKLNNGTADSTTGMGTISGNTATANGGGIYVEAGKTLQTVSAATGNVTHNTAQNGAGIYNAGNLKFYGPVSVDGNTATGNGGGIYQGGEILNGLDTKLTVTNNTAGNGGGVYVAAATTLKNGSTNTITGNSATNGGGIYVEADKTLTFETSNITENKALQGGGMYLAGTLANSDGSAQLTFKDNDTTAGTLGNGGALYIDENGSYGATGKFVLNRQEDFHFVDNGHYTSESDATRGGAIYNAGTLEVANTNYGFGVKVEGDPNGVKTRTILTDEVNTGIGAAVYNAGTFTNASEYKAFHAGGIDTADTINPVDTKTYKTYSFYVTGQKGESAFASSGTTTLSNAKIYGNSTGGLRVDDGLTTLTQGTEIGSGAFILATTAYANYAEGFGTNTGYGVKVTGGNLESTEAQTYAQYTNKRKNTEFDGAQRYEDYQVADAVQISGNTSTAIIVEGTGKVFLNDMRAESNGAAGLNAAATAGGYITNAVIEGTIDRGGVTLVNTTIPGVTETDTTNNIAGENAAGDRFVVDELGNIYTLNSDFDAIDTGTNANAKYHFANGTTRTIKHDLGGHDRIINGRVDLGAFECPISWITNTMFIDDIKYAVEHCAPVAFGGKVKFDINCNGKVFYWDEDPRALNPPSVHNVPAQEIYVDKDTILDARYEDTSGNYYWMDIVMDFGDLSVGFTQYYSNTTFNVYGLTVVATNGGRSENGSAFFLPETSKGGSVVNLYGVSCYDCKGVYGGAIYAETNAVVNIYADVTANGYVTGEREAYTTPTVSEGLYQPKDGTQKKVVVGDTYRASVFEGNTATYGGAIYSNNQRSSTVIGGVEYTTGLNIIGVDLQGKTYVSTGRVANSEVTKYTELQYDETTDERGEGTDAVRQYSSQFIDNQAGRRGGAINLVGKGVMEGVTFIDNYTGYGNAPLGGGALFVDGYANLALKNGDFIENSSELDGGAIMLRGKLTSDGNLVFAGNSTPYNGLGTSGKRDGGAIYCYGGTAILNAESDYLTKTRSLYKVGEGEEEKLSTVGGYGSEFLNNEANFGGAVEITSGTMNFTKALFQRNKASVGGALYNETTGANVTVGEGSEFKQNYASTFAGAVYNNAGSFTSQATFTNNWATNEGALYSRYEASLVDSLESMTGNYATGPGSFLYYNYWMDSYDGQEAVQKTGKELPIEVSYFGKAGVDRKTEASLEPVAPGLFGITNSPNSTQSVGTMSEWENIYAVVTLNKEVGAGDTIAQELDIDTNVFQVGQLSVAAGWEGQVSVTDDGKVLLTLNATSDCSNVGENIASLEVLTPEEGLAENSSLMGVEVQKAECYDLVKDGRIDIQDLVVFAQQFGTDNTAADFNGDTRVDISDLVEFARNFGQKKAEKSAETLALAAAPQAAPVAEPAAVVAEPVAAPAFLPAQSVKLETVEAKEEPSAAVLAAELPVAVNASVQARDSIFSSDEDEEEDWLDDLCSDLKRDAQTQLIDDLFGKN